MSIFRERLEAQRAEHYYYGDIQKVREEKKRIIEDKDKKKAVNKRLERLEGLAKQRLRPIVETVNEAYLDGEGKIFLKVPLKNTLVLEA